MEGNEGLESNEGLEGNEGLESNEGNVLSKCLHYKCFQARLLS